MLLTRVRRVSLGREVWRQKEFGGDIQRTLEEGGIRDMIARMTPKKPTNTPIKATPVKMRRVEDEIMLTPGMMKREFGPKVASLVKVWEDQQNMEEEDEFLTYYSCGVSFYDEYFVFRRSWSNDSSTNICSTRRSFISSKTRTSRLRKSRSSFYSYVGTVPICTSPLNSH